jgi:hypothetical protein
MILLWKVKGRMKTCPARFKKRSGRSKKSLISNPADLAAAGSKIHGRSVEKNARRDQESIAKGVTIVCFLKPCGLSIIGSPALPCSKRGRSTIKGTEGSAATPAGTRQLI